MPISTDHSGIRPSLSNFLEKAIFAFLTLFAIALPFSIKGAERAWKFALILWLLKLVVDRTRPWRQPLVAPLLAYVILSAISTALSPDPYLSWDRMKLVCLCLAGIVVAQNLLRLSQIRWLVVLLVLSGFAASVFTAWQYTYGVGVRLVALPPNSRLSQLGFQPNDVIDSVGSHATHTERQLIETVQQIKPRTSVAVKYLRGWAVHPEAILATPEDFAQSGLGTSAMRLDRGRPIRAQGTLGHYVVFAEMLMQIACMAWALMLATSWNDALRKLVFGLAFLGMLIALFATQTRAALAGLLLGCLVVLPLMIRGRRRNIAITALFVILVGATFWIQHTRKIEWVDRSDVGMQFRVLMWEDGLRLVREHPWFGVGMETVRLHYREWNIRGFIRYNVQSHFHSNFLQLAVERGIPALLAWLWFSVAYLMLLVRLVSRLRGRNLLACGIAAGILASFIAFTASSFVHYSLGEEPLVMILFFYYGIAAALDRMASPETLDVL